MFCSCGIENKCMEDIDPNNNSIDHNYAYKNTTKNPNYRNSKIGLCIDEVNGRCIVVCIIFTYASLFNK